MDLIIGDKHIVYMLLHTSRLALTTTSETQARLFVAAFVYLLTTRFAHVNKKLCSVTAAVFSMYS